MSEEFKVTLPKLGESIMSATIVQWFKKEGDTVAKDEALLEVATDKVNSEIPSPVAGILKKIEANPDQEKNVGELLAVIETGDVQTTTTWEEAPVERTSVPAEDKSDFYSPSVLRLAREKGISMDELSKMHGTGEGGRITKKDLEGFSPSKITPIPTEGVEAVKMSPMRKAIAENMVRSFFDAPHATLVAEVDVTNLMATVKKEKEAFQEAHGCKLSITAFVLRAVGRSLTEYPMLNATLQGDTILVKKFINIGIAVSVDDGLMVPVIRDADKLDLPAIAKGVADFAGKARTNSLSPDDVKEGTVTMTNFGMSGVLIGTPIIRHPEVAIVGIGGIVKRAVPQEDDTIAVRSIMNVSLTFDHRVIDGMYGCGFLGALKKHLETDTAT